MMKKIIYIAAICWVCASAGADNATKWKNYGFGVEIRTRTEKRVYKGKEPLSVFIDIRNQSKKSYFLVDDDMVVGILEFFSVKSLQGKCVPYTAKALRRLNAYAPMIGGLYSRRRPYRDDIPAGATKTLRVNKDLHSLVNFNKPGTFTLDMTIFLYEVKEKSNKKRNVMVLRTPKLSFKLEDVESRKPDKKQNYSEKFTDIKVQGKPPVFGLVVKRMRINRTVLKGYKITGNSKQENAELIVDIENVSKDKYPAMQWFGRYDVALWNSLIFHNSEKLKHDLFYGVRYHLNFKENRYKYCYDIILPGEIRQFKIPFRSFPAEPGKEGALIDYNGTWAYKLSRFVFMEDKAKYNRSGDGKLRKKTLFLPEISLRLEGFGKTKVLPPSLPMKKPVDEETDE